MNLKQAIQRTIAVIFLLGLVAGVVIGLLVGTRL